MTSILVTLPVQLMEQIPGLRTGNSAPLTVSFLRAVPLKQFISSLSISMYSSRSEIIMPRPWGCIIITTAPLPYNINPRYILYYYLALDNGKLLKPLYTGLRKTINVNTFQSTKIPVPPRTEQDQIVRFLDWKISMVNRLINTKRREIKAVDAMKRSMVSSAVTRGIEPNAPMKFSGTNCSEIFLNTGKQLHWCRWLRKNLYVIALNYSCYQFI